MIDECYVICSCNYSSIQRALDAAVVARRPLVRLDPGRTYWLDEPLNIPGSVRLDGGGQYWSDYAALLRPTTEMPYLVRLGGRGAGIQGCQLHCDWKADAGIFASGVDFPVIEGCRFLHVSKDGAAIRMGGVLYPFMRQNACINVHGYGLDALAQYKPPGSQAYYGINTGISEQNILGARQGSIRLNGILTSRNDNFEMVLDGQAVISVGHGFQSHLIMESPYFELKRGPDSARMIALHIMDNGRAIIQNGQIHGDSQRGNNTAIVCRNAYMISLMGTIINRWEIGLEGNIAINMPVFVGGNYVTTNVDTPSTLVTGAARVAMFQI